MNPHNSLPRHAHTTHHDTAGPGKVIPASRLAQAGLDRVGTAINQTSAQRPDGDLGHAARARRLADLHTRRARWWAVLRRATIADLDIPRVYIVAVVIAGREATDQARFWTQSAADWQARAEQRPTSEVAGAMSNWADLGLTEPAAPGLPGPLADVTQ